MEPLRIAGRRDEYLAASPEGKAKILCETYGVPASMVWQHRQSGRHIIKHSGVEMIAAQETILVDYREVAVGPEFCVIHATPRRGDDYGQSTFGEASPDNTMQKHLFAMAEKRAYDRAVLKYVLSSMGGYGADFYSEEEADDFRKPEPGGRNSTGKTAKEIVDHETEPVPEFPKKLEKLIGPVVGATDPAAADKAVDDMYRLKSLKDEPWIPLASAFLAAKNKVLAADSRDEVAVAYKEFKAKAKGMDHYDDVRAFLERACSDRIVAIKESA